MAPANARIRVEVLGPLRVWDAVGRDVTPLGGLQRRLLALLVLRRGRVVSADSAIEALWPSQVPRDPAAALQNHLSRLRRGLPAGLVETVAAGYRLEPTGVELDADRLSRIVSTAGDDAEAWDELRAMLDRWRGPAFPELDDVDEGRDEAARLEDLRIRATEANAAARLQRGDTEGLAVELTALADREPLRERPRALLMSALAATGRTSDALRVYDDFRRRLGDEMGIEPSPALAAQHAALLADPAGDEVVRLGGGRLPLSPTPLVGRDALLADLATQLSTTRAMTLVGPGGVGKTRLLVEIGHRLQTARPERPVVLCELAAADRTSTMEAVAGSLGIDARPGLPPLGRIVEVLGDTELVLLLDNCEHVLDPAAALVQRVLGACPGVTVLTTSRERLRVPGELVYLVPTLLSADGDESAIELFVRRARAVRPGFEPDDEERACVAEIVRRLDGLPLAIELAAARLHTHDVDEVAAGLDQRFALLSDGYRASARHASLAAAVSWSFALLDDDLQRVFTALSVFSGSFSAVDAAAVCAVGIDAAATALMQLVERSLVMRAPGRRFVLLETLRAFGLEQLVATGRGERVGERHARRLVHWIEEADGRLLDPGERVLAEIDEALPELRTAFAWLLDHGLLELARHLVTALLDYGILRLRPDVLAWAESVTAVEPEHASGMAARVWVVAAYGAWMTGDLDEMGRRSQMALDVAERAGGPLPSEVAVINGSCELFEGRLDEAAHWYRRGVEAAADDPVQRLFAAGSELLALGYANEPRALESADAILREIGAAETAHAAYLWYCAGEADLSFDLERARTRLARAVELAEATNASFVRGIAGASKASIEARVGDPAVAAADYRWLIAHWRRAGMWSTQWTMLRSIAGLLERLGRHRDAAVLEGSVRATAAGHRIFGADERTLAELGARLRATLGREVYEAARQEGARLDGDAAVEHALGAL